ncbi:MAG: hypothetical protein ACRDOG_06720 [Gaiellaceae bacterium]
MDWRKLGEAGTGHGWRKQVADRATDPLASRLPLGIREVRAVLGLGFLALSLSYVFRTFRRAVRA